MSLTAITNAHILTSNNKSNVLNIGLKNQNIIALGYLPDDETFTEINAKHSIIIENTFNILDEFVDSDKKNKPNNGISITLNEFESIKFLNTYTFLKTYKNTDFSNNDVHILYASLTEFLFIIQEAKTFNNTSHFHIIIDATKESLQTIKAVTIPDNISLGLALSLPINFEESEIIELFQEEKAHTLSTKNNANLLPALCKLFLNKDEKIIQSVFNPYFLKNILKKQLQLGSQPSLAIINKKDPYSIVCTLKKGILYQEQKGDNHDI